MLLGFLLVTFAGICWIGLGVSVSVCASRKWDYNIVQGLNYLGVSLICLLVLACGAWPQATDRKILALVFLLNCCAGISNFFTYFLTAKAMRLGPNGLVWGMMQSGMIGSFLMGICFFGEPVTLLRLTGLILIIGGILAMGFGKDNSRSTTGKLWLLPSIGAFFLVMVTHCCNALPSFLPEAAATGSVFRTFGMYFGGVIGFALIMLPGIFRNKKLGRKEEWYMAAVLIVLSVSANIFLFYNGLNLLARAGRGSLAYPVAIGVCVVGFSLFSLCILKEKIALLSKIGLAAVCTGIIVITL